ncbi:hypothetical protein L9F63_024843, partial [Diploptera punctata]
ATSDAVKNEIKNIDIEEEITHNLVAAFAIKEETDDIKQEVPITEELVPIVKTITN